MFKMKKSSATRAFACLLILFMLLAGWAIAENAIEAEAPAEAEAVEQVEETAEAPAEAEAAAGADAEAPEAESEAPEAEAEASGEADAAGESADGAGGDAADEEDAPEIDESIVQDALMGMLYGDWNVEDTALEGCTVRSYEDAGVMTYNKGLVISLPDGSEFQLTIVQSC